MIVNLLQEELENQESYGIAVYIFQVKQEKVTDSIDPKHLGYVDYFNIKNQGVFFKHRQVSNYFSLSTGYYLLIPTVLRITVPALNYMFRVFSYDEISVEEVTCTIIKTIL